MTAARGLTGCLALFLLCNALLLNGTLWLVSPPEFKETVLEHSWNVVHGRGSDDSWGAMKEALDYAGKPHPTPLYSEIFFNRNQRFQYPPSALFALDGMLRLAGPGNVRTSEFEEFTRPPFNDIIGWLFLIVMAAAAAALLELRVAQSGITDDSRLLQIARAGLVIGLVLTFYPVVKAYTLGQIQVWINSMFAVALLCWAYGRKAEAGLLAGLMCLIKPHYAVFLLWGLLRREWRFAGACAATMAVGLAASLAAFGWANHVDYLRVVSFLSERGEVFYPNQSVNGFMNRLVSLADPLRYKLLEFEPGEFPPFSRWVYGTTLLTSVLILGAALWPRGPERDPDRVLDFCTMAVSATLASPIAWEHHYGILLPVFAVLLASTMHDRRRLLWIIASYVLASTYVCASQLLAPTVFNPAMSYLLVAVLIVLVLLHTSRPWRQSSTRAMAA